MKKTSLLSMIMGVIMLLQVWALAHGNVKDGHEQENVQEETKIDTASDTAQTIPLQQPKPRDRSKWIPYAIGGDVVVLVFAGAAIYMERKKHFKPQES